VLASLWLLIVVELYDAGLMIGYEPLGGLALLSTACLCQALCFIAVLTVHDCLPRKRR
jgi:hypothetical protein